MKNFVLLKVVLILLSYTLRGQVIQNDVIGTAGNTDTIGGLLVSWTLGETVTEKFTDTECIATQGFHQTYFTILGVANYTENDFKVICYPNPTLKDLHVKVTAEKSIDRFILVLYDMQGKILFKVESGSEEIVTIDLSRYNTSVLLLHAVNLREKQEQVFKIIKQNHF